MPSFLLFVVAIICSSSLYARDSSVFNPKSVDQLHADITILQASSEADLLDAETMTYSVRKAVANIYTVIDGKGQFAEWHEKKHEKRTQMYGRDLNGFENISLERVSDHIVKMSTVAKFIENVAGEVVEVEYEFLGKALIVDGTWDDFKNGKTVKIAFTDSLNKARAKATAKLMEVTTTAAVTRDLRIGEIDFDTVMDLLGQDNTGYCKASVQKLICYPPNTKLELFIDVYF